MTRDTDGSPKGTDPKGLDGEAATAGADRHRQNPVGMTNPKQPDSSLVEVVRAFIDEHCAGPNGGELTVCSSPSLVEWNSLRTALTAISPSLRAQRDAEIADEYMTVTLSKAGVVVFHHALDADWDEMVAATQAIIDAAQARIIGKGNCPFSRIDFKEPLAGHGQPGGEAMRPNPGQGTK